MYGRYRKLRQASKLLPFISSGSSLVQCRGAVSSSSISLLIPLSDSFYNRNSHDLALTRSFGSQRLQVRSDSLSVSEANDLLPILKLSLNKLQGPSHLWLNTSEGSKGFIKRNGTFLVLTGQFIGNSQIVTLLEKVKLLQQRFSDLQVMGFHCGSSSWSAANQTRLLEIIMEEYITFPILVSKKNFQVENGACYMVFKDFANPAFCLDIDLDVEILSKAIEQLLLQEKKDSSNRGPSFDNLKCTWVKALDAAREPYVSSHLQNLLFYLPACISVDESGNRLFVSDSNHHRVVVIDGSGKILDCIGSRPGFEDGDFGSAKMFRPASSFYDDAEDCLYIVDSENHAIRRADMKTRLLETLYPTYSITKNNNTIWTWIVDKLGFGRQTDSQSKESDLRSILFPWHLLKLADNLYVTNHSFETLWVLDASSGQLKATVEGFTNTWETMKQLLTEKLLLIEQLPTDWLLRQTDKKSSQMGFPYANLVSSVTTFQNDIVLCDTVSQDLLKLSRESGTLLKIQYSNFEMLGFPYWLSFPLERVNLGVEPPWSEPDHFQSFSLLPGRVDIKVYVDIPEDTELVEPLQEGSIWQQIRGAASMILEEEGIGIEKKTGVSQQWYDELDELATLRAEPETIAQVNYATSVVKSKDDKIQIDCAINTSPGTSELIVYAALYMRLRQQPNSVRDNQEKYAARIADILSRGRNDKTGKESCVQLLLRSDRDLRELVFVKPLHVRIKVDSLDHPKPVNKKDYILTDSSIEVDVSV